MIFRKKFFKMGICLFFALLSSNAIAGWTTAKIASIVVWEGGDLIYVFPEGGVKNTPACDASGATYLSFSLKRPRAREYYAGLLAAYIAGKTVQFRGADACTDQSTSETLQYFQLD
ncbi:hypothetical protein GCN74_09205 [Janthinobacterium sp. FT14W]|uniref:hypothetical protein n=1 Tax=Janthinobacterium sp. FT14W TaxID=2654253 RepID=UPI0012640885|nr:hypothetical protein [Janthinobacterium sp. FT14W]KAB8060442.1 hypothetical protein GCN74_09205 [Janthinobacterium sp. FT14W]